MAVRKNKSMGFVDAALDGLGGVRSAELLKRLDEATPWATLAAPIAKLPEYARDRVGRGGRPTWDPVHMLRCLMLAKWFNLSDPGLEEALKDRISFRRFAGLSFTDTTPDETTFVRFRARLREANIHDTVFKAVVAHIESQGLLVREGTMVDATIIEQSTGRKRDDGTNTRDQDASFTHKHGRSHHGYKGHIACDLSGIVTEYRFGTAKEHDSRRIDELTRNEKKAVGRQCVLGPRTSRRPAKAWCDRRHHVQTGAWPGRAVRLAEAMERVGVTIACPGGASVRNAETPIGLPASSIPRPTTKRVRLRDDDGGVQFEAESESGGDVTVFTRVNVA